MAKDRYPDISQRAPGDKDEPNPSPEDNESKAETELSLNLADDIRKLHDQNLLEAKETHELRIKYTHRIFVVLCVWLFFLPIYLVIAGSGFDFLGFKLSDNVLIAFIASTLINVLGLFVVVAKWMFPHNR